MAPVIIAFDIGSSSIRCTAYRNDDLFVVTSHSIKKRSVLAGGWIDAQGIVDVVDVLMDQTMQELSNGYHHDVSAVGFSSFCMNLVGVDADGNIVGNAATLSYAHQSQAVNEEVASIKRLLGDDKQALIYRRTGAPIHSSYALPQLLALYAADESAIATVSKWQTLASLCFCRWIGCRHLPIAYSEASWTGLLNVSSCQYDPLLLDLLPKTCRDALPSLEDYTGPTLPLWEKGTVADAYFNRWPAMQGAQLFLGLGDGACANVGSKCSTMERIACTVGTSAAARVCIPLAITESLEAESLMVEPGLFCYRISASHVLLGGALTDGGSVVEWVAQLLNLGSVSSDAFQECLQAAAELPPTSSPTVVPFLSGERSTGFRTGATGAMVGFTRETKPEHFLKGCLQGVTLRLHAIVMLIRRVTSSSSCPRIICSGKALEVNELWRTMLADCTGCEIVLDMSTQEGTSRGVAMMVRAGLNDTSVFDVAEELDTSSLTQVPDEATAEHWRQVCESQEELLNCLSGIFSG